jgi:hypothetical protein
MIAALIVNMLLLSSCLKEDMSSCPEQIRVYFTFTTIDTYTGEGDDPINPDDVDRMCLFIFSEDGYFLGEYCDDNITDFSTEYFIECSDLMPGKYRFIAWGGKDESFYLTIPELFVKGKTTFDEAFLILKHPGNTISAPVHHIFHSDLPATVTYNKVQRFDMPLAQLSNTINIRTVGLPADNHEYMFIITDNNDVYYFDRSFATYYSAPTFTYNAPCTKDAAGQLNATLNVLRLAADRRTPQLQIYNKTAGTTLYPFGAHSGDLIGLIRSAYPENDFEKTHTYNIVIVFGNPIDGDTRFTLTIFINGWQVRDQNEDLVE